MWPFRKRLDPAQIASLNAMVGDLGPRLNAVLESFEKVVEVASPLLRDATALNDARVHDYDITEALAELRGREAEIDSVRDTLREMKSRVAMAAERLDSYDPQSWWPRKARKSLEDWQTSLRLASGEIDMVGDALVEDRTLVIEPGAHRLNMFCSGLGFVGIALRHHEYNELRPVT